LSCLIPHRYPHRRGKPDRRQARPPSSADEVLLAGKVEEQREDGLP